MLFQTRALNVSFSPMSFGHASKSKRGAPVQAKSFTGKRVMAGHIYAEPSVMIRRGFRVSFFIFFRLLLLLSRVPKLTDDVFPSGCATDAIDCGKHVSDQGKKSTEPVPRAQHLDMNK